jgi:hypothetical protein
VLEDLGVDTATIIANAHLQSGIAVGNLRFDHAGTGVSEGVGESLAAYEQEFLARNRMKITRYSFARPPEPGWIQERELFAARRECLRQLADMPCALAEIHHSSTTLVEHLIRALQGGLQQLADGFAPGDAVGNRLEAQHQTLYALQEGVVKVACDAFAFGQALLQTATHFGADLRDAEIVETPQ